ncbi:PAS domain S-box protein, partial [Halarchaeum acidiphilum]
MTDGETISVLCVDDEPGLAELVGSHLARADDRLTSVAVTSAAAAFETLEEADIDCIVSDYELPETDGIELLEAVRADDPDVPFILFTGRGSEELASRAISAGVTDYLRKEQGTDQYALLARQVVHAVERVRARRSARVAEDRRRTVLEASPDPIVVVVDGVIAYANPVAIEVVGAAVADDVVGRPVEAFVPRGERESVLDAIERTVTSGEQRDRIERSIETLDGRRLTMEATRRRVTWDGGTGVVAILRDVTGRERERASERDRYRAVFEGATDALVIVDDDGRCVEANDAASGLFGLSRSALVGRHVGEFLADDAAGARTSILEADVDHGTFPVVRPDGETRVVACGVTPGVMSGERLLVLHDVTERAELGERLEREQSALEDMYRITADGDASFDEKLERLLALGRDYLDIPVGFFTEVSDGQQRIDTIVGDSDVEPGTTVPLSEAYCRQTVAQNDLVTVRNALEEGWGDDPAYERFGLGCYVGAKVTVDGAVYGTFCFADSEPREEAFTDTERTFVELMARWVSYELERRQTTERLEAQNERLERFASVVSHDLRSPLSVASGYLDLGRERVDADVEAFDRVAAAHERMTHIIDDLLVLAREGDEIGEAKPVDLADLVASSWDLAVGGDADATLAVVDDLGTVTADPDGLRHLLENLFRNTVEHAAGDDGRVRVTVGSTDASDGFYVADDGPGIAEERRERVFEDGYTTRQDGTGFGLSIVSEIAAGHGWDVAVTESATGGARFALT